MPLSNAQYDEIMHEYDERQLHNRHILETRRAEVLKKLPRLKELMQVLHLPPSVRRVCILMETPMHWPP